MSLTVPHYYLMSFEAVYCYI